MQKTESPKEGLEKKKKPHLIPWWTEWIKEKTYWGTAEVHTLYTVSVCVCVCARCEFLGCDVFNCTQARASPVAKQDITPAKTTPHWRLRLFHVSHCSSPSFSPSLLPTVRSGEWNIHEVIWMTKEVKWGRFKGGLACDTWWQIVTIIVSSFSVLPVWKRQKSVEPGARVEMKLIWTVSTVDGKMWRKAAQNRSFNDHWQARSLKTGVRNINTERRTPQLLCGQLVSGCVTFTPEVATFWRMNHPSETSKRTQAAFLNENYPLHMT